MMFEPRNEDLALARRLMESGFGNGLTSLVVPRVDRDLDATYAIATLTEDASQGLAPHSRTRPDVGPNVVELAMRDPEGGRNYVSLLRLVEARTAFVAIVPADKREHVQFVESRFSDDEKLALQGRLRTDTKGSE